MLELEVKRVADALESLVKILSAKPVEATKPTESAPAPEAPKAKPGRKPKAVEQEPLFDEAKPVEETPDFMKEETLVPAKPITVEEVKEAAMRVFAKKGKKSEAEIVAAIKKAGAEKISEVPETNRAMLLAALTAIAE